MVPILFAFSVDHPSKLTKCQFRLSVEEITRSQTNVSGPLPDKSPGVRRIAFLIICSN